MRCFDHRKLCAHLPVGPVWALHGFHLVTTALMLFWYARYALLRGGRTAARPEPVPAGHR